ncbi:MAG: polyprenyl synthetase family protein [Planctomycetales bacterium]|nr:polyprenyl synthetase family protein [Planctomycetales bacterium]
MQSALKLFYAPIEDELKRAEQTLISELRNESPFVNELLEYGGQLGGKRLRPALLLLTAKAAGEVTPSHYTLAAVVEMIHTATLVHDDVLDEAAMRRHLATVNARWNNETSVLLGDYLFTHAFYLASTLETTFGCRRIGQSTNIVCEGELRQIGNRGNHALSEAEYFEIIDGKTAELCACACHLGAHYANADDAVVASMERYGRLLGMAFQIADDLLDLLGDESQTGKSLGTDLDKQKPTLPIIHTYQTLDGNERQEFVGLLESEDLQRHVAILEWVNRCQGLEYARKTAIEFTEQAREQLNCLKPSACRDVLSDITEFVVARSL